MVILPENGIFVGKLINLDANTRVLYTQNNGEIFSGPNRYYEKGAYLAEFIIKKEAVKRFTFSLLLQVIDTGSSKNIIAHQELTNSDFPGNDYYSFTIPFILRQSSVLNFSISSEGQGNVWFKKISLKPE